MTVLGSARLGLVCAWCVAALWHHADGLEGAVDGKVQHAWEIQDENDHFEILYLEYVIASWNLSGTPWNAYHSAIAVRKIGQAHTQSALVADYTPQETDEIRHVVHPQVTSPYPEILDVATNVLGLPVDKSNFELSWNNRAYVNLDEYLDRERYKNITYLGEATGKAVNQLSQWIYAYNQTHSTFEPLEIAVEGQGTVVPSTICHDFVNEALWELYNSGEAQFDPENHIFRDHIVLYASSVEQVTPPFDAVEWNSIVTYYQKIIAYMGIINVEFTNARLFFARMFSSKEATYLYSGNAGGWYNKFYLQQPYLNYCYMPLYMPPERADIFSSPKHCALPQTLDASYSTSLTPTHYFQIFAANRAAFSVVIVVVCLLLYIVFIFCRAIHGARKAKTE